MKIHVYVLSVFAASFAWGDAPPAELKITGTPPSYETGTMWYQERVVFALEGYQPLVIAADMEKDVYPTGGREVHKLGPARFLVLGGYSTGGGRYTSVAMIIAGQEGRLVVQDQLEFKRDRRRYEEKVFKIGSSFAVGFPPLPAFGHELWDWHFKHKGTNYGSEQIRGWPLKKGPDTGDMITFMIGDKGFLLPDSREAGQGGAGNPPKPGA